MRKCLKKKKILFWYGKGGHKRIMDYNTWNVGQNRPEGDLKKELRR